MSPARQRGSRVIYVARSARDLPEEVQAWLGRADHRAASVENVYELLALLATGRRPSAILVSMDEVDWGEMDFFDHVARLSGRTNVYVTGHDHHEDKIAAACARGARRFDAAALTEDLKTPAPDAPAAGAECLVAGSLQTPFGPTGNVEAARPTDARDDAAEPGHTPPGVRLVAEAEQDHEEEVEEPVEADPPIPFPWRPAADRPKRVSPRERINTGTAGAHDESSTAEASPQNAPIPTESTEAPARGRAGPVELTPDELAALIGKPPRGATQERRRS